MPNFITGLKYQPPYEKIETEEKLIATFSDLKNNYDKLTSQFKITAHDGKAINTFKQFLDTAIQEKQKVILTGSGDIGGLVVKNASLEYDLSKVGEDTVYWNILRETHCHNCLNHYYKPTTGDEMAHACSVRTNMDWSGNCKEHNPYLKNSEGKPVRKLSELIDEATK